METVVPAKTEDLMSEYRGVDQASLEEIRRQTEHLRSKYVLLHPFEVVDAALWEYLAVVQPEGDPHSPGFKRTRLTSGNARFTLRNSVDRDAVEYADIYLRAVGREQTYIDIQLRPLAPTTPPEMREFLERNCLMQLIGFISWLWVDTSRMEQLADVSPTSNNSVVLLDKDGKLLKPAVLVPAYLRNVRQGSGRPPTDLNEWARAEVARGRKRDEVFGEYLRRQEIDPEDENEVERAKERFRKLLSRTKRT